MDMMIESAIMEVTTNIFILTVVILSVYPVVYIIRSMIQFVSRAFNSINVKKYISYNFNKMNLKDKWFDEKIPEQLKIVIGGNDNENSDIDNPFYFDILWDANRWLITRTSK